jgi:hypothetical protein
LVHACKVATVLKCDDATTVTTWVAVPVEYGNGNETPVTSAGAACAVERAVGVTTACGLGGAELALTEWVGVAEPLLASAEGVSEGAALDETADADVDDELTVVVGADDAELELTGSVTGMLEDESVGSTGTPSPVGSVGAAVAMATASAAHPATADEATTVEITLPIRM